MAIKLSRVVPKKALNAAFLKVRLLRSEMHVNKSQDSSADTTTLEAEIDEMVYDFNSKCKRKYNMYHKQFFELMPMKDFEINEIGMYGLTEEERKIVEGK